MGEWAVSTGATLKTGVGARDGKLPQTEGGDSHRQMVEVPTDRRRRLDHG